MGLCDLSVDSQLNETLRLVDPIGALDGLVPFVSYPWVTSTPIANMFVSTVWVGTSQYGAFIPTEA